jgi:polysaccharide export outer membrane protein
MKSMWNNTRCHGSTLLALIGVLVAGCGSSAPSVIDVSAIPAAPSRATIPTDPTRQAYTERGGFPEYIIGAGDRLRLTLRDVKVTQEEVSVRPDGNVSFTMLEDVPAAGRTPTELDDELTVRLGRFLRTPKVDVEVLEYHSKIVSVLGAIETLERSSVKSGQGRYPLKGKTTLLDIIREAGGTTPDAQLDHVQLIRGDGSFRLDLRSVLASGAQRDNIILQGGDVVIVPGTSLRSKKVIILGEVTRPNVYMFAADARLMEALSQAGDFSDAVLRDDIRLIRVVEGTTQMYSINFERFVNHGDFRQNVALENDDIIFVPRRFIGDVNDVIAKIEPLLNILLLPATYRDLYTTGGGLLLDTGDPPASTASFTRTLPGTGKPAGDGRDGDDADDD